jgi:hypothetical protein
MRVQYGQVDPLGLSLGFGELVASVGAKSRLMELESGGDTTVSLRQ